MQVGAQQGPLSVVDLSVVDLGCRSLPPFSREADAGEEMEAEVIRESINPPVYKYNNPIFDDDFEQVLVEENDKAMMPTDGFERLETVYLRYEPMLINRLFKVLKALG